jgi:hypothetical protein
MSYVSTHPTRAIPGANAGVDFLLLNGERAIDQCRKHETLGGKTPVMASGLTDHAWTMRELLDKAAACF